MNGASVFFVSLFTAAATAAGTVYAIQRYDLLPPRTPPDAVVPDLRGVTENDARANAAVAHVAILVAARETSADAKTGTVLRQSIAPGTHVARDYPIGIVIADEMPRIPSLTDLTVAEATQRAEQKGFSIQVAATSPHPTVASGRIFEQSPKADTPQPKGGTVTVQVSSGPGDVELPKLIGIGVGQAKTDLEKLGMKPVVKWVAMAETPTYVVLNMKPKPGDKVKPGSGIELTVCR